MEEDKKHSNQNEKKPFAQGEKRQSSSNGNKDYKRDSSDQKSKPNYHNQGRHKHRSFYRKKICRICGGNCTKSKPKVDYKDVDFLSKYISEKGKILPRRMTGTCAKAQRKLTKAIKRARTIGIIPFTAKF